MFSYSALRLVELFENGLSSRKADAPIDGLLKGGKMKLSRVVLFMILFGTVHASATEILCQLQRWSNGLIYPVQKPTPIGPVGNPTTFLFRKGMKTAEAWEGQKFFHEVSQTGGLEKFDKTIVAYAELSQLQDYDGTLLVGLNLNLLYVDKNGTRSELLAVVGGAYGRIVDDHVPVEINANSAELDALDGDMINLICTRN